MKALCLGSIEMLSVEVSTSRLGLTSAARYLPHERWVGFLMLPHLCSLRAVIYPEALIATPDSVNYPLTNWLGIKTPARSGDFLILFS